jgi:hypothetical protein
MNEFWVSELGEIKGNSEDAFTRQFKIIPDNTMALAIIHNFINSKENAPTYLDIEWKLIDGEFKGQIIHQKLKVFNSDEKIRYRALNMFKLLYKLFKLTPKHKNAPSDEDLSHFIGKIAGIKIRETEPNEEGRQYNWVSEVHEAAGFKSETGSKLVITHKINQINHFDSAFERNSAIPPITQDDVPF